MLTVRFSLFGSWYVLNSLSTGERATHHCDQHERFSGTYRVAWLFLFSALPMLNVNSIAKFLVVAWSSLCMDGCSRIRMILSGWQEEVTSAAYAFRRFRIRFWKAADHWASECRGSAFSLQRADLGLVYRWVASIMLLNKLLLNYGYKNKRTGYLSEWNSSFWLNAPID